MKRQCKPMALLCGLCLILLINGCAADTDLTEWSDVEGTAIRQEESIEGSEEQPLVAVYVCGAVQTPGVYYLTSEQRVTDAVNMAGGFLEDADRTVLNLAAKPADGEKLYVPAIGETNREEEDKININTADVSELTKLPGIGESRAADIVRYREKNGKFSSIEDIKKVAGIKESVYEQISDRITVN